MKKYIIFDNDSKKVRDIFTKKPNFINKLPTTMVAEYEGEIPQADWLTVTNVKELGAYLTCDLVANFKPQEVIDRENKIARINELKQKLKAYDYIGTKIATGRATKEEYATQIAEMTAWANEINELEVEVNN